MADITLIFNMQGFVLPDRKIVREISWTHLTEPIAETIQVFTPDCVLNDQEMNIVRKCTHDIHGLRFKRYSDDKNLWISQNNVLNYIQYLYEEYGGTFAYKGGVIEKEIFEELHIPSIDIDVPKCPRILGPMCSLYKCGHYKKSLLKNANQ